jgi:hypothetical protein
MTKTSYLLLFITAVPKSCARGEEDSGGHGSAIISAKRPRFETRATHERKPNLPDERKPIEATPLSATSAELGLSLGLELDSLAHFSSHTLPLMMMSFICSCKNKI